MPSKHEKRRTDIHDISLVCTMQCFIFSRLDMLFQSNFDFLKSVSCRSTKIRVSACVPVPPVRNSSEGRSQQYKENLHLQLEEHQKQLLKHIQIEQPIEEKMEETEKEGSSSRESSEEGISKKLDDVKGVSVERDAPPEYAVIRKSGRSNKPLREVN